MVLVRCTSICLRSDAVVPTACSSSAGTSATVVGQIADLNHVAAEGLERLHDARQLGKRALLGHVSSSSCRCRWARTGRPGAPALWSAPRDRRRMASLGHAPRWLVRRPPRRDPLPRVAFPLLGSAARGDSRLNAKATFQKSAGTACGPTAAFIVSDHRGAPAIHCCRRHPPRAMSRLATQPRRQVSLGRWSVTR
jgi:hypothetical protein